VAPEKVIMLQRAGLAGIRRADGDVVIGAATPIAALADADEPLAATAGYVADPEIRGQATVGGNLCAAPGAAPRGDLQAPLLALGARVRSVGPGGERVDDLEAFLAGERSGRLVLDVRYPDEARRAGHASVHRPHAHHFSILIACAVRAGGETRIAVAGAGPTALRARAVEEALDRGEAPPAACRRILDDVSESVPDDALASAWYRKRVLPTLVGRALADLEKESA
jgi:carbon-monoxide dehydrogenase medium subunit